MTQDRVSIVMPAYNNAAFIGEAAASVQSQTHANWELIVVDDASQDGTEAVARDLARGDARIRLLRLPQNSGSAAARNAGLRQCTGRYIAFLDADDLWMPQKLERQFASLRDRKCGFSFTAYRKLTARGQGAVIGAPASISWRDMLKGNRIGCSTVLLDTNFVRQPLSFPTGLGRQEDYALWLALLRAGGEACGINEPLVLYRVHPSSKSARKLASVAAQWRVYREFEQLSPLRAAWYLGHYAVRGVLKTLR